MCPKMSLEHYKAVSITADEIVITSKDYPNVFGMHIQLSINNYANF